MESKLCFILSLFQYTANDVVLDKCRSRTVPSYSILYVMLPINIMVDICLVVGLILQHTFMLLVYLRRNKEREDLAHRFSIIISDLKSFIFV